MYIITSKLSVSFLVLSWITAFLVSLTAHASNRIELPLVEDYYPYYSNDGKKITFFSNRSGQYQIYLVNRDGSDLVQLTNTKEANETPVFSIDDSKIYFQSHRDGNAEIYVMDVDGKNLKNLTNHPAEDSHPKLSPDGKRIIFDSKRNHPEFDEVFEMDINGDNIIQLTTFDEIDSYASISPDGKKILWRRILPNGGDKETAASGRNSEIFIMDRDGSNIKNLSNHAAFDGYPSFSPDGKRIVFSSTRDRFKNKGDGYDSNIYIMDLTGNNVKRLTETTTFVEQVRPMWSPDGKTIIYNRDNLHQNSDRSGVAIYELKVE